MELLDANAVLGWLVTPDFNRVFALLEREFNGVGGLPVSGGKGEHHGDRCR